MHVTIELSTMDKPAINLDSLALRQFCRKWRVKELAVFGSYARGDYHDASDIDFVIDHQDGVEWDLSDAADMRDELSRILGKKVDLLTRYALEHTSNWLFRKIVLSSMETVYAAR